RIMTKHTNFNKSNYKNIFTIFIINDHPPRVDHGILNSRPNGQQVSMELDKLLNYTIIQPTKLIQVNCKVPNTDIQIKKICHFSKHYLRTYFRRYNPLEHCRTY
ncbi:hypothetical protein DMUE_6304, partial [Dictyocoela muelleri]